MCVSWLLLIMLLSMHISTMKLKMSTSTYGANGLNWLQSLRFLQHWRFMLRSCGLEYCAGVGGYQYYHLKRSVCVCVWWWSEDWFCDTVVSLGRSAPSLASRRFVCVSWWYRDRAYATIMCCGGWVPVFLNSVLLTEVACCTRMSIPTITIQHSVNV